MAFVVAHRCAARVERQAGKSTLFGCGLDFSSIPVLEKAENGTVPRNSGEKCDNAMQKRLKVGLILAGILIFTPSGADDDPLNAPDVQSALRSMHNRSTWFHPDTYAMTTAMQY